MGNIFYFGKEQLIEDAERYIIDHFPDISIRTGSGKSIAYTKDDARRVLDVLLTDWSAETIDQMNRNPARFASEYLDAIRKEVNHLMPEGVRNDTAQHLLEATLSYFDRTFRDRGEETIWRKEMEELLTEENSNVLKFDPSKKRPR